MLYWRIGKRVNDEVLKGERADYGETIVSTLARLLTEQYGRGFSVQNLRHMIRFAEAFQDEQIVSTPWRQLGWSHFKEVIYLKEPLQMEFYAEMCRVERWSVRRFQKNRIRQQKQNSRHCAMVTKLRQIWYSSTLTSWISWV